MRKHWIVTVGLVALLAACASVTPAAPATPLEENAQETAVLAAIEAATPHAIVGDTLTLKAADGTSLEFRAA